MEAHPRTGQPVGLPVDTTPAPRPGPVTLKGRYGTVGEARARARCGPVVGVRRARSHVDLYCAPTGRSPTRPRSRLGWPSARRSNDPYAYAIIDAAGRAVGYVTLAARSARPCGSSKWAMCSTAGAAAHGARHRNPIPVGALRLRNAGLSALRMEMRRAQCSLAARRPALRLRLSKARSAST